MDKGINWVKPWALGSSRRAKRFTWCRVINGSLASPNAHPKRNPTNNCWTLSRVASGFYVKIAPEPWQFPGAMNQNQRKSQHRHSPSTGFRQADIGHTGGANSLRRWVNSSIRTDVWDNCLWAEPDHSMKLINISGFNLQGGISYVVA